MNPGSDPLTEMLKNNNSVIGSDPDVRQIEDMNSSKNVVEIGVFYYRCPFVTLGDLGCTLDIPKF